jgi:hypothetical protein
MKFLVPNCSCLQNPWLGGYRPQIPVLSVLCPQLNLLNPPPPPKKKNSWVRHWSWCKILWNWFVVCIKTALYSSCKFCGKLRSITMFTRLNSRTYPKPDLSSPSLRSISILLSHLLIDLPRCVFHPDVSIKILQALLLSIMCAACPAHFVHSDRTVAVLTGGE